MAFERQWPAVAPQQLTADGGATGIILVTDTRGFKVKATAVLSAQGLPDLQVQICKVIGKTKLQVGPVGKAITLPIDCSAYTYARTAFIYQAQQEKTKVPQNDRDEAAYEQEPTVAYRTVAVDEYGQFYDQDNPMPIAFNGTIEIGEVAIVDQNSKDPLKVNQDGSLNVNIVPSTSTSDNVVRNLYGEANAVPSGELVTITSYMVPPGKATLLQKVQCSGENLGKFQILVNGTAIGTQRTYFGGDLNCQFDFTTGQENGLVLSSGTTVSVTILHNRPYLGDFEARIQVFETTLA